jgi:cytosine/adenosine deaminase-related metal-dependent hydrolase
MMPRGRPGTKQAARVGAIEVGRHADLIAIDGDPLQDVSVLLKPGAIRAVYLGGESCTINSRDYDRWAVTDLSSVKWTDVYTRAKVMAGLR